MEYLNTHVMNLANSIIGVSILAMPYCFHQCGIILSILMLLTSSIISRLACHFLLKSAIISRRKTFEYLAFHIFGSFGKLGIEFGIIGFLMGTCVAFFVVIGDLGPEIISEITGATTSNTMRTSILMALALFGILPLGLLRNVDSLSGVSQATIGFYCCLVLKVISEATPHILKGDWYQNINMWKPQGILQCLPIFSMALFCQTQLFEIYQAVPNATLEKMNNLVRTAVNICTCAYIFVGIFGYIAFSNKLFTGNILLNFEPSFITYFMKIGFIVSVAVSFPLVIFPCRASMYSLLYKEGYSIHEGISNYIPEGRFKALTMIIVFTSLIVGIMIPNIELVLGLVGSTIGVMICVIFPVTSFICLSPKNTNERILAQFMLMIGIFVMVLGTYENLHKADEFQPSIVTINTKLLKKQIVKIANTEAKVISTSATAISATASSQKHEEVKEVSKINEIANIKEIRHEPPQPIEPFEETGKDKNKKSKMENINSKSKMVKLSDALRGNIDKDSNQTKNDEVDMEAIKKEEKEENEVQLQEKEKIRDSNQMLIDTIRKQNEVQKEIVEQQKKLMEVIKNQQKLSDSNKVDQLKEEKLKAVKEIQNIALKAIEKISGKDDHNVKMSNVTLLPAQSNSIKHDQRVDTKISNGAELLKNPINHLEQIQNQTSKNNKLKIENTSDSYILRTNDPLKKYLKINSTTNIQSGQNNKHVFSNLTSNNTFNNTAPLFLKLGVSDLKISDEKIAEKLDHLPIAISDNFKHKNSSNLTSDISEKMGENEKADVPEIQAMRREILQFVID